MPELKVHVLLSELGHLMPPGEEGRLLEYAQVSEAEGAAGVSFGGHIVLGPSSYALGPLPSAHSSYVPGHIPPDTAQLEPLAALSLIAGATTRIRLDTCILIAALYPPAFLAKSIATLDAVSGGRLEIGIGTSWQAEEFAALGVSLADRGRLTDEAIDALHALWEPGPTTGRFGVADLQAVQCVPVPVQPGGVPLWFGGNLTGPVLRRIVAYGRAWLPRPPALDVGPDIERLHGALIAAGRQPEDVELRALLLPDLRSTEPWADLDAALEPLAERVRLGFSTFVIGPAPFCRTPEDVGPFVREVVARVSDYS